MTVSTIEGTLEAANLKRRAKSVSVYDSILFRRADGSERRLGKTMVANAVADALQPGARGRFYLYSAIDHKGLHGLRTAAGAAIHEFPGSNERLMLVVLVINLVLLIGRFLVEGMVWFLPLGLVVMAGILYPLYRKTRTESRRQFDSDSGYAAAGETEPATA
jgi:hypothetical protein